MTRDTPTAPPIPRTATLTLICLNLAVVAGALSFSTRFMGITEAVELQQAVWQRFQSHAVADPSENWLVRTNSGRILMPAAMAALADLGLSWPRAFSLVRLSTIVLAYLAFLHYLRGWFTDVLALVGLLLMAATLPLTFNGWFEVPTDFPELLTFTLAFVCLRTARDGLLLLVVLLGTLNRETTFFIPILAFAARWSRGRPWPAVRIALLSGLAWAVPYVALRWWTGASLGGPYSSTWPHNLAGLRHLLATFNPYNQYLYYIWLFGPFWLLAFARPSALPPLLRRSLLTLPAFLYVYLFQGGYLNEPRPIIPLYCMLLPAGLFVAFPEQARDAP